MEGHSNITILSTNYGCQGDPTNMVTIVFRTSTFKLSTPAASSRESTHSTATPARRMTGALGSRHRARAEVEERKA